MPGSALAGVPVAAGALVVAAFVTVGAVCELGWLVTGVAVVGIGVVGVAMLGLNGATAGFSALGLTGLATLGRLGFVTIGLFGLVTLGFLPGVGG